MDVYPLTFEPIYREKLWGGRNLERLFGRALPPRRSIGESWELADLEDGTSVLANGPQAGTTLTELTRVLGSALLGRTKPLGKGRFPLLLKLLDANDILSLQVHPDAAATARIGPPAALKTECWYVLESRGGSIYKGVLPGVQGGQFRDAIEADTVEQFVRRIDVARGDFHYLPAGTVHALGAGVVVAEVQTPSDTTYRVTDWARGREIHVERSMQCIHFEPADDAVPGAHGAVLLRTEFFVVSRHETVPGRTLPCGGDGVCTAVMLLEGDGAFTFRHAGAVEPVLSLRKGRTVLLPAGLQRSRLTCPPGATFLQIDLPEAS